MKITTRLFGELDINSSDILHFPDGLFGFENHTKFVVIDPNDKNCIVWLQSMTDEKVAFPIIEPKVFFPDYTVTLMPSDLRALELVSVNEANVFTILTIPSNVTKMTANLKSPIIINRLKNVAKQIILQDNNPVQFEMFKTLKQYLVSAISNDVPRTSVSVGVDLKSTIPPASESIN